jgi:hypothetical protein
MAATTAIAAEPVRDQHAILAAAYPMAQRIAYSKWQPELLDEEIDGLLNAATITLLDKVKQGKARIVDVPRTTKYLSNFIDWRANGELRARNRRRDKVPLPDEMSLADDEPTSSRVQAALTAGDPTPEDLLESRRARALIDELETRIPDPVNRLIVHLFFFHEFAYSEIADTVWRLVGIELTPKAVERRKAKATKRLTKEWGKALSGAHCHELAAAGAGDNALSRYALGLFDLQDDKDRRLHDIVAAHLRHCAGCRSAAAATRREMRQLALLAAPILIGVSEHTDHTGQQAIVHAPGVFDRALDTVRSGIGRGTIRAAETLPNGASAGEMAGSAAGAGGTAALGGGLAAKFLIVGTTAICAFGGQQLCVHLLASPPIPKPQSLHTVALRPKLPHDRAMVTPSVKAAQVQPRAGATASQQLAHRAHVAAVHRAQRRAAARSSASSTPSTSSASSSSTPSSSSTASAASTSPSSDPSLSPTEPTTSPSPSSASGSSSGSSSGGSASSGSSGDSTFQGLP